MMTYKVFADSSGKYRWHLKGGNGQIVAVSGQSFADHINAVHAARDFKDSACTWTYEVYADTPGNYRWRAKADNRQIVASSGESFDSRSNARRAMRNVQVNGGKGIGPYPQGPFDDA